MRYVIGYSNSVTVEEVVVRDRIEDDTVVCIIQVKVDDGPNTMPLTTRQVAELMRALQQVQMHVGPSLGQMNVRPY